MKDGRQGDGSGHANFEGDMFRISSGERGESSVQESLVPASQARLKKARSRRSSVQESLILDQVNFLSRSGSSIRPRSPIKLLKDSDLETKWKFELFFVSPAYLIMLKSP